MSYPDQPEAAGRSNGDLDDHVLPLQHAADHQRSLKPSDSGGHLAGPRLPLDHVTRGAEGGQVGRGRGPVPRDGHGSQGRDQGGDAHQHEGESRDRNSHETPLPLLAGCRPHEPSMSVVAWALTWTAGNSRTPAPKGLVSALTVTSTSVPW